MEHRIVRIDAGEHTEELAKFIAQGLSDDELDLIDLEARETRSRVSRRNRSRSR